MSLTSKQREELYDREVEKSQLAGRGDLPICNICDLPVNGASQAWDESHEKHKPKWLGGIVDGIAHRRCNRRHNNTHDTPLFAKGKRQRQRYIGARVSSGRALIGSIASGIKKPLRAFARPIDRATGREF